MTTTLLLWIVGSELPNNNYLLAFALAVGAGLIFAFIKIVLASCVASYVSESSCLYALFVDVLTERVAKKKYL